MAKKYNLNKEEREILNLFETGVLKSAQSAAEDKHIARKVASSHKALLTKSLHKVF